MSHHTPRLALPLALLALASCASAPTPELETLDRNLSVEQAALRAELGELRALLIQSLVAAPSAHEMPPSGVLRVVVEGAAARGDGGAGVREAAARVDADGPAIEALVRGLETIERQRDVLCENVANEGTVGYKRREIVAVPRPMAGNGGSAPETAAVRREMTQGALEATANQLDLAIEGRGFFEVE